MDRNAITGLVLITIMMLVYYTFFAPKPPEPQPAPATEQALVETPSTPDSLSDAELTEAQVAQNDSLKTQELLGQFSDFYKAAEGEGEELIVKTEKLSIHLNTKGGNIKSAFLNEHMTFDSLPLPIIQDHPENDFSFDFTYKNKRRSINSNDLVFSPLNSLSGASVTGQDSLEVVLRASIDENRYIDQIYTFYGDRYDLGYEIKMVGIQEELKSNYFILNWRSFIPKTELSVKNMRQKTTIAYRQSEEVEKLGVSDDPESEELRNGFIDWIAYKSQFFTHTLIAEDPIRSADVRMETPITEEINRIMSSTMTLDAAPTETVSRKFRFYMGPNEYNTLNSYKLDLQKQMDLGWWIVGYINIGTVYIFNFLEKYFTNYGVIILLLAFIFRMGVFPMTYRSHVSMAKMRVINQTPEMKALDEKHKDDPQKLQMAKMGIYREMGASPFGGCLPMLFSYPFLIALFFFFPQSVELRQQSFLWAHDLSTYDSVLNLPFEIPFYGDHVSLFTILMAISTFFYTLYQQKSQPNTGGAAGAQMKMIAYFMPIFLLVFLNNYASGLSLYYFASNLITMTQTTIIRAFMDDKKLLADMEKIKKSKKNKKGKGGSTKKKGWLEKWAEDQQKKQQEILKQRKNSQSGRKGRRS